MTIHKSDIFWKKNDLKTQISFGIKLFENSLYEIKNKKDIKQNQNESKLTVDNNKNKTKNGCEKYLQV